MNNIHINMNEFTNASRVLKQVDSLVKHNIFENITIIALGSASLPKYEQLSENISLYRVNLLTRGLPKNISFQSVKYIEFLIKSLFLIYKEKPSVVNAHALSVLPIALISKMLLKTYLVYDTHELETERNGLFGFRKKMGKVVERSIIKHVDRVFVVSESIADWYMNEYSIERPTVVLNVPNKRKLKKNNSFRKELDIREDQIIILYQGALSKGRGIEPLINAFKNRDSDKLVIVFMGYGELENKIKEYALKFNNIFFYPAVHPEVLLEFTSSADIGINLGQNVCLSYYYSMPNKFFEYAMTGLPVIVSNLRDMADAVINNNMGIVIEDYSEKGINSALDDFLLSDLSQMKQNAYRFACNKSWEVQEEKMIGSYKNIIKENK